MIPSVRPSVGPSHSLRATPSIEMGGRLAFISCELLPSSSRGSSVLESCAAAAGCCCISRLLLMLAGRLIESWELFMLYTCTTAWQPADRVTALIRSFSSLQYYWSTMLGDGCTLTDRPISSSVLCCNSRAHSLHTTCATLDDEGTSRPAGQPFMIGLWFERHGPDMEMTPDDSH